MTLPDWNDPDLKAGTMSRGALWLIQEVGEGNVFTKEQIREAFPGVTQADRRIRDLRSFQWVIDTNVQDVRLSAGEQRFVQQGIAVWDPRAKRAVPAEKTVTAKERQAILAGDDYMCTVCGISAREPYVDDSNQTGLLGITRRPVIGDDGNEVIMLVTECKRCRAGTPGTSTNLSEAKAAIEELSPDERRQLSRWVTRGRRGSTMLDRAWNTYWRLPQEARAEIRSTLGR